MVWDQETPTNPIPAELLASPRFIARFELAPQWLPDFMT
jgi:hypothetical protein